MGIRGLQSFMMRHHLCEKVELAQIAEKYRNETGKDPVILMDVSSIVCFFYTTNPVTFTTAGELKKFKKQLEVFTNYCTQLGIKLKIFADGKRPPEKLKTWIQNNWESAVELKELYSGQKNTFENPMCRGTLLEIANNFFLMQENCEFLRAINEADDLIIEHLKAEEGFAIFTNDTDFLFANSHYCFTMRNTQHFVTLLNLNKNKLAKHLGIKPSQLPLFAALCEGYSLKSLDLKSIYKVEGITTDLKNQFFRIAEVVKKFTNEKELIQLYSELLSPEQMTCLKERLNFYSGKVQDMGPRPVNNQWDEILILARQRHTTGAADYRILKIMENGLFESGICWENILINLSASELVTLRKKIYGILFFENPVSKIFIAERTFSPKEGELPELKMDMVDFDRSEYFMYTDHDSYVLGTFPPYLWKFLRGHLHLGIPFESFHVCWEI